MIGTVSKTMSFALAAAARLAVRESISGIAQKFISAMPDPQTLPYMMGYRGSNPSKLDSIHREIAKRSWSRYPNPVPPSKQTRANAKRRGEKLP